MRRTTAILLLAVALAAGVVIMFSTSQPSKPNFSVRVIRFTLGDTNAVLEITNRAACHVDCWINVQDPNNLAARQPAKHTLTPHSVKECPISVPANLKMPADVSVSGHQPIKYWALRRRLVQWGSAIGVGEWFVPAHYYAHFTLTNTTEWMNSGELRIE